MDLHRAESFSDAVFAVAITVLAFNLLSIADKTAAHLTVGELTSHWPAYLAYVVSFLTVGIMWLQHHIMLAQVPKVDRPLLVLNVFQLMGVVVTPFPTALVADHLTGSASAHGQDTIATVTYGLVLTSIAIWYGVIWIYLTAHQEALGTPRQVQRSRLWVFRLTGGIAAYAVGALIAFVSPVAALSIFGLLAIYYMVEWMQERIGKRINTERIDRALGTEIVVTCPAVFPIKQLTVQICAAR